MKFLTVTGTVAWQTRSKHWLAVPAHCGHGNRDAPQRSTPAGVGLQACPSRAPGFRTACCTASISARWAAAAGLDRYSSPPQLDHDHNPRSLVVVLCCRKRKQRATAIDISIASPDTGRLQGGKAFSHCDAATTYATDDGDMAEHVLHEVSTEAEGRHPHLLEHTVLAGLADTPTGRDDDVLAAKHRRLLLCRSPPLKRLHCLLQHVPNAGKRIHMLSADPTVWSRNIKHRTQVIDLSIA